MICFEFICAYGVRPGSRLFYLYVDVQSFLVLLLKHLPDLGWKEEL